MDHVVRDFSSDIEYSSESFIVTLLHGKPEHKHLDVLTDLLTKGSEIDERVASSISAAWHWICQNDLWSTRYESLSDYRKAIGYMETVRPIVQRHKKSELAKRSSTETIFRYWKVPFDKALPIHTRPLTWSKHLLSLTACLSKHLNHLDSLSLLENSMKNRPERGRTRTRLMASDVQRALETLGIPQTLLAARGFEPPRMRLTVFQARKSRTSSSSAQNQGTDSCVEADTPPSTIHSETSYLLNTQSQSLLPFAASPTEGLPTNKDPNEWQCCGCIPICLPLIALITTPQARLDTKLLTALVEWAYTISWGSFCSEHLMRLAHFIPTEDLCDSTRADVIHILEAFCSRGCYSSIATANSPFMTGSADAWWRWKRDGFLHIPGFFSYMEEFGVFRRVRKYLGRGTTKEGATSTFYRNFIQQCYEMISQMVQRDPAYYAVLVACRPDQNQKLVHRPRQYQQSTVSQCDGVGLGVPIDSTKLLAQGEVTSDIHSTVILPTCETAQKIRLVPVSHGQCNSWSQSPLEAEHGDGCKVLGEAQEILVLPGDLIMCLPQILRWPATFPSSNFLNLSQTGLDNRFTTPPEQPSDSWDTGSFDKVWEQPEPLVHDSKSIPHEYHTAKADLIEDSWCSSSSAIGQALTGRLDWGTDRVREEMNYILGSDGATAVEFVTKSRAQLAKHFHHLCDSIERGEDLDSDCRMNRYGERGVSPDLFQGQNEYLETPESFTDPLTSTSPTWNNPSIDDMVADLNHTFSQQPMSFDLP
ncbi:hypothetical protein N7516_009371 [Penicillium verrucosum]|uniref:uncharacterized protein n=1 Tax=Penicillium verrucosum TaxID=60171 RepID=UPI002544E206|nr:uncharacterized protein N7516_009371 [Penicillium verrucosum]KAJ5927598.1 hypothetical protein N7516_009371 [Penicillium verrucosum]